MTTATSLQPGTQLHQREIYLSILKALTIMDDIFMRNVLKDSTCTEYILKVIMDQDNLKLEDQILQADCKNLQGRSSILDCNLPIYHINRVIEENCQQCYDQLHIIYVNSSVQDNTALGKLMHDLHCSDPHDMHSEILAQRVLELKETQKGVYIMCDKLNELIAEERNEGEKRGILIGEAQGILHTQKETAKNLQHMGMALEQISQALNVSVQMIQEWVSADYIPAN